MAATTGLRDELYREILSHIQETDETVPYREGGAVYYVRTEAGRQYPIFCRRSGREGEAEEVLLDQNTLAAGHDYLGLGARVVSGDGRLLAYSVDSTGYRQYTLFVKDLETGRLLDERVERVASVAWAADHQTLFFVTEDATTKRQDRLFRHTVGSETTTLVYCEADEEFDIDVSRSRDGQLILLEIYSKTSGETRFVPAASPQAPLRVVTAREPDHEYDVTHHRGRFVIRTNKRATNFRVVTAPVETPDPSTWTELVAHRPDVKIDTIDVFARHLVLSTREGGLEHLEVVNLATDARHRIAHPEPVYSVAVDKNKVFDTGTLRFGYQSLTTPPSIFEHDMDTGDTRRLKETAVPGGFRRDAYVTERLWAEAPDGVRVPISLVRRRDGGREGPQPLLLYAYGSYGISIPPAFSAARLPLLDRGVTYAIAHVRGGGELGEPWRAAGRLMRKTTTFTDFIACAEHLIRTGATAPDRLCIQGGSAGGLLVGAVVNLRPDLFSRAIAQVPFVDVVNTMLDATLPLTTGEYSEWGNPIARTDFDYILGYSPYDNLVQAAYPALLVKVSLHDSQVPYWEGAKFVAKLRTLNTGDRPVLLKVNFGAGHSGASGRYDAIREIAWNWSFILARQPDDPIARLPDGR